MNRVFKGLSYSFKRNLGWQDRLIRAVISIAVLASLYFGYFAGTLGLVLGIIAFMILGTAAVSRCSLTYMANSNTMGDAEKSKLDAKGISYE